jgi:hypothetical protein
VIVKTSGLSSSASAALLPSLSALS